MNHRVWLLILPTALAVATFAQDAQPAFRAPQAGWSATMGPVTEFGGQPVTGAPYSADEVVERVQTLADGTHLSTTSTTKKYRDSLGRTRTERPMAMAGPRASDAPMWIEISDPVAQVHYVLNVQDKTATRQSATTPEPRGSGSARPVPPPQPPPPAIGRREMPAEQAPETTSEKLDPQTMEGLMVEGTRQTTTWPVGSMWGNDRPFSTVNERWLSPELKVTVLTKRTDPRNGDTIVKLVNISRAEPDPNLFRPPADYTVTENQPEGFYH